jgi:hypothetical protein
MKMEALELRQTNRTDARHGRAMAGFAVALAVFLVLACALVRPKHYGDMLEYSLMTVALANHASPDIRLADVSDARALLPDFSVYYDAVAEGLRKGADVPIRGLLRGADGQMYAIHFFAFPALAAVPFKLLETVGRDPFRCYLAVNAAFVFALGLALFRLFGNARSAVLGLLTYFLCGGMLYFQWSSPESMSAAALLAALIFYCTGMPILGGVLAGLGAMQNPPIVFFCAFAPLLRGATVWRSGQPTLAALWRAFGWRYAAGLLACAALFGLNILFSEATFDTPSIIAKVSASTDYIGLNRLHSFFFDLNQGMILGVPAVAAALLFWPGLKRRMVAVIVAACAFAMAMAAPSLVAQNWNSGAAGIMRYTLWASMPLLFVFFWRLRLAARWPTMLVTVVLAVQAVAMYHAGRYGEVSFSPLARLVMTADPGWYNPDPEIFYERASGSESWPMPGKTFAFAVNGQAIKTLYNVRNPTVAEQLCGPGRALAPDNRYTDADRGWRYINGPVRCNDGR